MQQVLVRDVLVTHYETVQGRAAVQRLSPVVVVSGNVRIVGEYGAIATNAFVLWCPRSVTTATKSFVVIVRKAVVPSAGEDSMILQLCLRWSENSLSGKM